MLIDRKVLGRRTVLRGLGAAVGLPLLESMTPALSQGATAKQTPNRLLFSYIPIGATMEAWTPEGEGPNYTMNRILKPLEPFRQDLSILSGLDHAQAYALGDGGGDHARAAACFLTGVHPKKTATDILSGISADQIVAQAIGSQTRFASIELGCEDSRTVGACDSGYSCAYQNTMSWRTPTSPMPPEINPRVVFERLFGSEDLSLSKEERARNFATRKSILDWVVEDTQRLNQTLPSEDRRKIDEYLYSIREVEQRIESAEKDNREFTPSIDKPSGVPVLFSDYLKLMFDLQLLAIQSDLTRVTTFMFGREGSLRTYNEIGIPDPHHPTTHHRGNPELVEKVTKINTFHAEHFAYFLGRLKSTPEGDGNLLDHSMVVYASAIADGSRHTHTDLPAIIAGHGKGALKVGQHTRYAEGTPMTNLWLTLLDRMDIHPETIGDSTGRLEHLTEL
jgi:hypothetical protein